MNNRVLILLLLALVFVGCRKPINHENRTPLVEVEGRYLYVEDLRQVLPMGVSRDDSVLFAEEYIKNWIEDVLLLKNAERNISGGSEVEQLVEAYRRSLLLHLYQQAMVEQRLSDEITRKEIDSLYRAQSGEFRLDFPLAKGLYIKIPLKDKNVNQVRLWYSRTDRPTLEKLEKYSLENAVDYLYFYDQWMRLDDIVYKLPLSQKNAMDQVLKQMHVELKDTAFYYFLHVDSVLHVGQTKPLDYAEGEIREVLMNTKRMEFVKKLRNELYDKAQEDKKITYYY